MLYIITDINNTLAGFILEPLKKEKEVEIVQFSKKRKSFLKKIIRYFESRLMLINGGLSLQDETKSALQKISKNDSVLFFDVDYIRDIQVICKAIPAAKKRSIFLWNPLQTHDGKISKVQRNLKILKKLFDHVFTFDPEDANQYELGLMAQPFVEIENNCIEKNNDIYFAGSDKGRLEKLIFIKKSAVNQGLHCKFHITPSKRAKYSEEEKEYLSYSNISYVENINIAEKSKCLLEIVQENQSGPTMRSMEAAFLGCKLITNRKSARQDIFYHPNNVLIIEDGIDYDLKSFINSESVDLKEKIHKKHSIKNWWHHFL